MGLGIPPLDIEIMLESNPPESRILVRILAVLEFLDAGGSQSRGFLRQEMALNEIHVKQHYNI